MPEPFDSVWLLHLQHEAQLEVSTPANLLHGVFLLPRYFDCPPSFLDASTPFSSAN
jgi:hypothetical protein